MCVLSIKVPIGKKSGNLFNDPLVSINFFGLNSFRQLVYKLIWTRFLANMKMQNLEILRQFFSKK